VHYDAPVRACVRAQMLSRCSRRRDTAGSSRQSASIDIRDRVRARPAAPHRRRPVIAAAAAVVAGASPKTT